MSERGEVEVLVPMHRPPKTLDERTQVARAAFDAAVKLVRPHGGRIVTCTAIARGTTPDGNFAMKARFLAEGPEAMFPRRKFR